MKVSRHPFQSDDRYLGITWPICRKGHEPHCTGRTTAQASSYLSPPHKKNTILKANQIIWIHHSSPQRDKNLTWITTWITSWCIYFWNASIPHLARRHFARPMSKKSNLWTSVTYQEIKPVKTSSMYLVQSLPPKHQKTRLSNAAQAVDCVFFLQHTIILSPFNKYDVKFETSSWLHGG